jgi:hypothetical protein
MLHRLGPDRYEATCSGCLETLTPFECSEDSAIDSLVHDYFWELGPNDILWCLSCARRRREVKLPRMGRRCWRASENADFWA